MNIVVVEDEGRTRRSIVKLINKINPEFRVIGEADNGYDGMLLIKSLCPDVVIVDIMMPKVNGLEMIENARECSPNTNYLILSGYAEFDFAKKAIQLSVVDYLLKPITVEQLTSSLNAIDERVKKQRNPKTKISHQESNYSPIVQYIVNSIMKNYAQRLYMEDFAEQLKVTPEYAGTLFSKETGKSFSAFLRDIRMEKAKELLENTNYKIYEIAYRTGYSDVKYFCRVFKECTGVSPKNYVINKINN